jgi:hypothetical protein
VVQVKETQAFRKAMVLNTLNSFLLNFRIFSSKDGSQAYIFRTCEI